MDPGNQSVTGTKMARWQAEEWTNGLVILFAQHGGTILFQDVHVSNMIGTVLDGFSRGELLRNNSA